MTFLWLSIEDGATIRIGSMREVMVGKARRERPLGPWVAAATLILFVAGLQMAWRPVAALAHADIQGTDLERTRQRLEGSFELEEWKVDGRLLRPPQVEGRFSIHDGVILFMTLRRDQPIAETVAGYGSYRIDSQGWTYGYTHLETLGAQGEGPLTRIVRPPSSSLLKLQWDGDMLIVIGKGSDRREYGRDSFTSQLSGSDYRKWHRIGDADAFAKETREPPRRSRVTEWVWISFPTHFGKIG
jgi:hypothetical protein